MLACGSKSRFVSRRLRCDRSSWECVLLVEYYPLAIEEV
jgi:hypothetical protein